MSFYNLTNKPICFLFWGYIIDFFINAAILIPSDDDFSRWCADLLLLSV